MSMSGASHSPVLLLSPRRAQHLRQVVQGEVEGNGAGCRHEREEGHEQAGARDGLDRLRVV